MARKGKSLDDIIRQQSRLAAALNIKYYTKNGRYPSYEEEPRLKKVMDVSNRYIDNITNTKSGTKYLTAQRAAINAFNEDNTPENLKAYTEASNKRFGARYSRNTYMGLGGNG